MYRVESNGEEWGAPKDDADDEEEGEAGTG